jgi:hypothetical protein
MMAFVQVCLFKNICRANSLGKYSVSLLDKEQMLAVQYNTDNISLQSKSCAE